MAAGSNRVPERLINFRVYNDAQDVIGIANVTLPTLESMTETTSGAGVAGEVESPILGHYGSMELVLSWRTVSEKVAALAAQKSHSLDIRGSQQIYDASRGVYETQAVKLSVKGVPKSTNLGTFEVNATTDSETTLELTYLKLDVGGKTQIEVDKFNFIAKFGDEDVLESSRKDLGLA